jgi:hypothetical protein
MLRAGLKTTTGGHAGTRRQGSRLTRIDDSLGNIDALHSCPRFAHPLAGWRFRRPGRRRIDPYPPRRGGNRFDLPAHQRTQGALIIPE